MLIPAKGDKFPMNFMSVLDWGSKGEI
jgi:hypothetical protein